MEDTRKRLWIAIVVGSLLSVTLFFLSYATRSLVLGLPQLAGFFLAMIFRGVHGATKADFAMIGIPVNAAIYAVLIYALTGRSRKQPEKP